MTKFKYLLLIITIFLSLPSPASEMPLTLFPIEHYSQRIDSWLNPQTPNYKTVLLNPKIQHQYTKDFYNHFYATDKNALSPWSKTYVETFVKQSGNFGELEKGLLQGFKNLSGKPETEIYGENFRPYGPNWFEAMEANMNLRELSKPFTFSPAKRAILVRNTLVRMIPTHDVGFYSYQRGGQGYPFDNFQVSAIWLGTPVYVVAQSKDKSWNFIIAASYVGWVEANSIAMAAPSFVQTWQTAASRKLLAITHTQTPILGANKMLEQTAYVGTVLPMLAQTSNSWKVLLPDRDNNSFAHTHYGYITKSYAHLFPMPVTRENFAILFKTLQGRPYGWGGACFNNDCSQELRSLYTPFGIWLPRNTADQAKAKEGKNVNLDAKTSAERIEFLKQQGKPLLTYVYIGGHVFLYLGTYPNPWSPNHEPIVMTYQNMWGLKPSNKDSRSVIGGAVFFPLLLTYPEDPTLKSQAEKNIFQAIFLGSGSK